MSLATVIRSRSTRACFSWYGRRTTFEFLYVKSLLFVIYLALGKVQPFFPFSFKVRMMVQRNVEIQLQALDLIERRQTSLQESENGESSPKAELDDKEIENFIEAEINKSEGKMSENEDLDGDKTKRLNLYFGETRVKTADIEQRQEYLRSQRDKILLIKKQARARQILESANERPTSSRAAQKIIDGETVSADESSIQLRKLLAKKLREEVVDKTE